MKAQLSRLELVTPASTATLLIPGYEGPKVEGAASPSRVMCPRVEALSGLPRTEGIPRMWHLQFETWEVPGIGG